MDDKIIGKLTALAQQIDALAHEVYDAGVREGRSLEYEETMQKLVETLQRRDPPSRSTRSRQRPPNAATAEMHERVEKALNDLAPQHESGVYPDDLAEVTRIKPREVRQALRRMTLTGAARRMARGRYLPASMPEPGTFLTNPHAAE